MACFTAGGCGGSTAPPVVPSAAKTSQSAAPARVRPPKQAPLPYPILLASASGPVGASFTPAVQWGGETAVFIARLPPGLTVLSFDQRVVRLALHAGSRDPGGSGWRYGDAVVGAERGGLIASFNGGFDLSLGVGGFMSQGRVGAPLHKGLGSVVTYADGRTDIGAWTVEVPQPGLAIESVRQNLPLLIDHASAASTIDCRSCWGATLGHVSDVARSALGITADGRLIWVGGEHLTVAALAHALLHASVIRAVELDINPQWVAAFLYRHRGTGLSVEAKPALVGQVGPPAFFLEPQRRDFFTILTR